LSGRFRRLTAGYSQVTINIYDLNGRVVKNLLNIQADRGVHKVTWNGRDNSEQSVASGIYIYKLRAVNEKGIGHILYRKMMLLR